MHAERYATSENQEDMKNELLKNQLKKDDKEILFQDKKKEANSYLKHLRDRREEKGESKPKKKDDTVASVDRRNSISQKSDLLNDISHSRLPAFRKDYLKEMRQNGLLKKENKFKVQEILNDGTLSKKDREELLKVETKKIEQRLKLIEAQRNYKNTLSQKELQRYNNLRHDEEKQDEDDLEVENMYINSIKAKLELLGDK